MLSFKPGVRLQGIRPELLLGLQVAESIYAAFGYDLVVTSGIDGKHKRRSEHYTGCAVDLRTHNVKSDDRLKIVKAIREALGSDFEVIYESVGTPNEHIHLEYDPQWPFGEKNVP